MLILNFFRRQVKKVLQSPIIVVSLGMEQILNINNIAMPWVILIGAMNIAYLPMALVLTWVIVDRRKK